MVHGVYLVSQKLPKMIPRLLNLKTTVFDELAEEGVDTDVNTEGRDGDGFVLLIVVYSLLKFLTNIRYFCLLMACLIMSRISGILSTDSYAISTSPLPQRPKPVTSRQIPFGSNTSS